MMLCLDCGNTRFKWGMQDESRQWLAQGALPLTEIARLPQEIRGLPRPRQIVACNVAGSEAHVAIDACAASIGAPILWVESRAEQYGVKNSYDDATQLGDDRWAALVGAHHLHAGNCLVVNAGTATTADILDADGIFQGGVILPGVDLMQIALMHNTSRLPLAAGDFRPLPRNTMDAITSGCLLASAGAIERMFELIAKQSDAVCLLSGGAADRIASLLDIPVRRIDNLVLEGLAWIGSRKD